jgi:hypothetical protein
MTLDLTPLSVTTLSPRLRKVLDPDAPASLRAMVARAGVPLPPDELVTALYHLSFDPDLQAATQESFHQLPAAVIQTLAITPGLDPRVLHALSHALLRDRADDLTSLLLHPNLHDDTLSWIALHAPAALADRICDNQSRLLQSPVVIASLYHNPHARQSSLDRVLELALRHNIDLEALGLNPQDLTELFDSPGLDEDTFSAILAESVAESASEHAAAKANPIHSLLHGDSDDDPDDDLDAPPADAQPAAKQRVGPLWQQVQMMNTAQKMRLAALGGREARDLLLKDSKRVVYMAAIRNPRIDVSDAQKLAANRSLPQDIISFISRKRDWTRTYSVVVNLVNNPKCPLAEATKFIRDLRASDLQKLQKNKNIPTQLARQAAALYRQRSGG